MILGNYIVSVFLIVLKSVAVGEKGSEKKEDA